MILAGDVGGTKVHLALYDFIDGKPKSIRDERYAAKDYSGLEEIVKEFLGAQSVTAACLGVPGPVRDGRLRLTNLPWTLDSRELSVSLGINHVFLINDLEANGYGINRAGSRPDLHAQRGRPQPDWQSRPDRRRNRPWRMSSDLERPHPRSLPFRGRATPTTRRATKTRSTCCAFSSRNTTGASAMSAWSAAWA